MFDSSLLADDAPITCRVHQVHTTIGEMGFIARISLENGFDTTPDLPCLLLQR